MARQYRVSSRSSYGRLHRSSYMIMSHTKLLGCASRVMSGASSVRTQITEVQSARTLTSVCDRYKCAGKGGDHGGDGGKVLNMQTVNPNIVTLQYAVRGPLVIRAVEIQKEIDNGATKSFNKVIRANIGDAHAMGQCPITFIRQVMACAACPSLIDTGPFAEDVKEKACKILNECGGHSVGAYTMSYGIETIRKSVAAYIERRDGHKANWQNICLCNGASTGIKNILQLFANSTIDGKTPGVMIPIPQYPLYSAALAELGLGQVGYYLDEENGWALGEKELEHAYTEGSKNYSMRVMVVINPGNPTGQVLTRENIETIVNFAHKKKLFLLSDEVYQDNVYADGSKFYSFKKVTQEMGEPFNKMELVSFMSASKCYMGECGVRGGWMELVNMDPAVQAHLYKALSAMLCPTSLGQIVIECVADPPKAGDPSSELFEREKSDVLASLAERAKMIVETFNTMEGFKCNLVQGAMYAFPKITLPPKAIETAKSDKKSPDEFYAFKLLEETGICIIPGSGFGQKSGTYHFRTTILPQPPMLKEMLKVFQEFHTKFTKEFA